MIISHRHRFIFIKTAKTAGTSIELFLAGFCSDKDIVTPIFPEVGWHIPRNYRGFYNPIFNWIYHKNLNMRQAVSGVWSKTKYYNHMGAWLVKHRIPRKIWDQYFKFCVERNPWDKALSYFSMLKYRGQFSGSFEEYLTSWPPCLNYPKYTSPFDSKSIIVDKVLRYEELDKELADVFQRIGIPFGGSLPFRAKSGYRSDKKSYREIYTVDQRSVVEKLYMNEINLHDYKF